MDGPVRIFAIFLRLGCVCFGGPIAHLAYFRSEFVERRRWLADADYAATVAMCQFLPGPASSQVGFALGMRRAGLTGACAAWAGFTLPSAVALAVAGMALAAPPLAPPGWLLGLKALAVAVVAHALFMMARTLTPSAGRAMLALCVAVGLIAITRTQGATVVAAWAQPAAIACGAAAGLLFFRRAPLTDAAPAAHNATADSARTAGRVTRAQSLCALGACIALLGAAALCAASGAPGPAPVVRAGAAAYTAGAMVFGGGHVVLPLLAEPFTQHHWLDEGTVLTGYALAQAVPGPLFTLAAFLGAAMVAQAGGTAAAGAAAAAFLVVAVFLPGLLLVVAAWPYWERLSGHARARAAMAGANAAVVGVLGAAFADPIVPAGVRDARSLAVAVLLVAVLASGRVPIVAAVAAAMAVGWAVLR